jgi:hypothetical protein
MEESGLRRRDNEEPRQIRQVGMKRQGGWPHTGFSQVGEYLPNIVAGT